MPVKLQVLFFWWGRKFSCRVSNSDVEFVFVVMYCAGYVEYCRLNGKDSTTECFLFFKGGLRVFAILCLLTKFSRVSFFPRGTEFSLFQRETTNCT